MDTFELLQRFTVALAIGLLIGLERGWQEREDAQGGAAGLRTHAIGGLLGASMGAIALRTGDGGMVAFGIAFAAFSAVIATFRFHEIAKAGSYGATTVVAAMSAFALGGFAMIGDYQAAAAVGVAVTGLLALKRALHEWVRRLTWLELRSALVLLAMSFILLPALPNRAIAAIGGLNPYELWLMTVMIAAISFAGYIAVRVAGDERGVAITGVAAGLVSSTAVTITLARLAREHPEQRDLATGGALLAGATMMARVVAVVGILNVSLMWRILPPLLTAALVTALAALYLMHRREAGRNGSGSLSLKNPFELDTVLKFGALLAAIMLLAQAAQSAAGASGVLGLAAISGIADVDAITLAMARSAGIDLDASVAARAIAIAVAVNTLSKAVLAWITGGRGPGLPMLVVGIAAITAGAAAFLLPVTP